MLLMDNLPPSSKRDIPFPMNILSGESEFDHHQSLSVTTKMAGNMLNRDVFLDQQLLRGSDEWLVNAIFVSYFRGICRYIWIFERYVKTNHLEI